MSGRRASPRASQPTQKVLETQAKEAARQQQRARETARLADRVGFRARGEHHASALQDGEEVRDNSDGSSDDDEEVEDVTKQQEQQQPQPGPAKKARRARKGKWTLAAKAMLANKGERLS